MDRISSEGIRLAVESPVSSMRMTLLGGPWGDPADAADGISSMAGDAGMEAEVSAAQGRYMSILIIGGASDEDYMRLADAILERYAEYMPQVEFLTEADG